ncbi:carbohydrate porin [Gallaecimonas mangrovi]|uniref:carbohydrate porin n=1 Tax=Gallaecimonas mangrovi TaxID=2291597 RepID=UPI000E200ED7|nr:carbohydrate porin [Gallaecimonas mangrovi]
MNCKKTLAAASALWLISSSLVAAHADDFNADEHMFGDLGGYRSKLHNEGIDVDLNYTGEFGHNLSGGDKKAYGYADQTVLGFKFDLDKLLGLTGGSFHFTLANRGGNAETLNDRAGIGELMQSMELHGRGRVTRIAEFFYDQKLLDGALDIKLGRLNFGSYFGDFQCNFAYLGFCGSQPGNYNSTLYNYPISQWAGVVQYNLNDDWYIKGGVYQMNPSWLENGQGMNFGNPKGTEGITTPVELGWTPKLNGLPGTWKLGYWHDNVGGDDLYYNQDGQPLTVDGGVAEKHSSKGGGYFSVDQQVTSVAGDPSRGFSIFSFITINDRDVTTVDHAMNLGVSYKGPFASRPTDLWSMAVEYLHVSDRLSDGERALAAAQGGIYVPVQDSETVFATSYHFQITKWFMARPEIQYIHNPGGYSENPNAWVLALKTNINF